MRLLPLLRFTLDLFESNQAVAPADTAQPAIESIALPTFEHPRTNRQARLSGALVGYEFRRSKRRTIGFSVGHEGLVVSAPRWVLLREVDAAVQEKSGWIVTKLAEMRERQQRLATQAMEWRDGASIPFLGQAVTLELDPGHSFGAAGAQLQSTPAGQVLRIGLAHEATSAQVRDAVQAWLMIQARTVFVQRLDQLAPQLQVQWRKLTLSNAGRRWGSARSDGSIRLNWRLVHFKLPVIDYVVAHELSHLRVMDHSPRFWDAVRSVVPDYAALRGQLSDDALPRWS